MLSRPRFANLESRHPARHPLTYLCVLKLLGPSHDPPPTSSCFQGLPGSLSWWDTWHAPSCFPQRLEKPKSSLPCRRGWTVDWGVSCFRTSCHPLGGCHEDTLACHRHPTPRACSAKVGFHSLPTSNGRSQDAVPSPLGF